MTKINFQSLAALLFSLFALSACGRIEMPLALSPIFPDLDPSGKMRELANGPNPPNNLLEAVIQQGVSAKAATVAFAKYDAFASQVRRPDHMVIIDFTLHSREKRFFLIDRNSGKVEALSTAHGTASDPDKDGVAEYFSNIPDSRMSSLGAYIINERYRSAKYGFSMRLDGLEPTNSNARRRAIVMHPSKYVEDGRKKQGWSWGCPAVPYSWIDELIPNLRDGAFMYVYGENKYKETKADLFMLELALQPDYRWTDESESAPEDGELPPEEL